MTSEIAIMQFVLTLVIGGGVRYRGIFLDKINTQIKINQDLFC